MTSEGDDSAASVTNVTDPAFGAVGDGTTDDTAAIRAAVSTAGSSGTVYFPPGEYLVSGSIDLAGASVDGAGRHEVTIVAERGGNWNLGIAEPGGDESVLWAENADHWSARHVGIDSNGENASCITNYGGSWVALTALHAANSDDSGIQHWGGAGAETGDCHHCLTAHNSVQNCRWNLVFDGSVFDSSMLGNVSEAGGARHVSLDNRTHTDRAMRGIVVANNALRSHGEQAPAEHAIYVRGGSANDAQRTTDGSFHGQVEDNSIHDWPAVGIQITRASGSVAGNVLRSDESSEGSFTTCLVVDEHRPGLRVDGNTTSVGAATTVIDHSAASPGNALWVTGNVDEAGAATFFASDATDDAWVFAENYAGTTAVTPE